MKTTPFALNYALAGALACAAAVPLAGCGNGQNHTSTADAMQAAEVSAAPAYADFEAAVKAENWALAKAQGDVILARHSGTEAANQVSAQLPAIAEKAQAQREAARLQQLWMYDRLPVDGGEQLTAAIYGKEPVDVDGNGATRVRLIFRDHPSWGKSSYLVLERGDFDCYGSCRVQLRVDDNAVAASSGLRPNTDEAIAMFIDNHQALWQHFKQAQHSVAITFPVKAGGTRTVVFEPAGLRPENMPGSWNAPRN